MTFTINRRLLLQGAVFGIGAAALPAWASFTDLRGFTHNVASGEPGQNQVVLWTRYRPDSGASARLRWQVASDLDFAHVVADGEALASEQADWCVKPVAAGLMPGRWYYFRFIDDRDRVSPIGRTRTLPEGSVDAFNIAVFSCANMPYGYFNAYAHAAARSDIDMLLHLGDYFYEYERGKYSDPALAMRIVEPVNETIALADYRVRFASYRSDPDLQRLHQLFPMVMMWDDHESANDAWQGGASNHQPETEGEWSVRKAASVRAYREWLPVSEDNWTSYRIGDLAHLFRPETRLTGRTEPLKVSRFLEGRDDVAVALAEFRDGPWLSGDRTILGWDQEKWLADGFACSTADGVKWQILGQQVVMGSVSMPADMVDFIGDDGPAEVRRTIEMGAEAAKAGLPFNLDQWDGYPAARDRLLRSSLDADAELIVLSGDSHNGWAFDLDRKGERAGVEFAVQSVSSPGYEKYVPGDPSAIARSIVGANPQLRWVDTSRRGYLTLRLTPDRAVSEWNLLETVTRRSTALSGVHRMAVERGARSLTAI